MLDARCSALVVERNAAERLHLAVGAEGLEGQLDEDTCGVCSSTLTLPRQRANTGLREGRARHIPGGDADDLVLEGVDVGHDGHGTPASSEHHEALLPLQQISVLSAMVEHGRWASAGAASR